MAAPAPATTAVPKALVMDVMARYERFTTTCWKAAGAATRASAERSRARGRTGSAEPRLPASTARESAAASEDAAVEDHAVPATPSTGTSATPPAQFTAATATASHIGVRESPRARTTAPAAESRKAPDSPAAQTRVYAAASASASAGTPSAP